MIDSSVILLDPWQLYTAESKIFEEAIKKEPENKAPIFFGRDKNGVAYVTDGHHRAYHALQAGRMVEGVQIAEGNFDVTKDPDFRPISRLKLIPRRT